MTEREIHTTLELLKKVTAFFAEKDIENPRLNAELLLAHTLDIKRIDLYLQHSRILTPTEVNQYREYVKRRANHEPVQYIIGETDFYTVTLDLNPSVLIPRPETEFLIDVILNEICTDKTYPYTIIDLGTGSGAIALALADNLVNSTIYATDSSEKAIKTAIHNSRKNLLENRVHFFQGNWDEPLQDLDLIQKIDIIVSNPPYISDEEWETLPREIKNYEPNDALYCANGISNHLTIMETTKKYLSEDGCFVFECGSDQIERLEEKIREIFDISSFNTFYDYAKKPRVIKITLNNKNF